MTRIVTRSLLLAVALAGSACLLPPEFVGGTLTAVGTGDGDGTLGTGATSAAETGTGTTAVESSTTSMIPAGAYGSSCELLGLGPDIQQTVITPQPFCDGGICLLVRDEGPLACFNDPECVDEGEGSVCGKNGFCDLTPAFIEANARCTQTCEMDQDCPAIPGCMTSVSCATFTLIGELCCQRVCACDDHHNFATTDSLQTICDNDPQTCT